VLTGKPSFNWNGKAKTMWTKEMMAALEADGEKLRQLTGEEHGPFEILALVTALLKDRNQMNGGELATETSLAAVAAAEALLDKRRARATL